MDAGEQTGLSELRIRLLGPPLVERAGQQRQPSGSKTWALLAYLALAERPPSRSRLAGLCFLDADHPRAALRWYLADLRRLLGPGATVTGDPVQLQLPPGATVDVTAALSRDPQAAGEVSLDGELLEGLTFPTSAPLEHWLLCERRRLAAVCESLLHAAAEHARRNGDTEHAAHLAGKLVLLDPYREPALAVSGGRV